MISIATIRRITFAAVAISTAALCVSLPSLGEETQREKAAGEPLSEKRKVDFARDVQPILQRSCYACHGPQKQTSEYRLDVRDVAIKGGEAYAPNIIAGNAQDSPLAQFIAGEGDTLMPPEGKGQRLSADEVQTIRDWIDQGVAWPDELAGNEADKNDWWSLRPLARTTIPDVATPPGGNAIDSFVRQKLAEKKLPSAAPADRRTLVRRVYFDLVGMPPTPEEVAEFLADDHPAAYENLVDRLLASPRYGERWARHWLDAAHFAETHGHDQDRVRENAWPYRDYVVRALNADKPYHQFVAEQVAGDVLFPEDPAATVALGFLAAGPWDESSLRDIQEDTLDRQIARYVDRDDMIATVLNNVSSMTVQCARCHDHKFDPISAEDYYSLQAVFAGVDRANRTFDVDAATSAKRRDLTARKATLERTDESAAKHLLTDEIQSEVARWEQSLDGGRVRWTVLTPDDYKSSDGSTLSPLPDGSLLSGGKRPERDTYTISAIIPPGEAAIDAVTAVRIETLSDDSLPLKGPGRQDNGNLHLSEIQVLAGNAQGTPLPIASASADFNQQGWEIPRAIDGLDLTAWGIYPAVGQSHFAVVELKDKLVLDAERRITVVLKQLHGGGHLIGRVRISVTNAAPPVRLDVLPAEISAILATPTEKRTDENRVALARFQQRQDVLSEIARLPKPLLVYAAASDFEPDGGLRPPPGPRPIHVLERGDIKLAKGDAAPGALSCVSALPARFEIANANVEGNRRAELARWLIDAKNPLTWRSIVNRIWQHHFGRGIVATANDFGRMGALPTHSELLDFLAAEFRDNGQSIKSLHRTILASATYRQSSLASTIGEKERVAAIAEDADNRFLWRMNRTRLDAECVRDAVLAVSGRLDLRMGGPSDRQFDMKPGIHVTPVVDYTKFDLDSAAGRRRSIYRFLFRTLPDPFMESLDCPSGDQITPQRVNSVTVQQALAMWNDVFVARHCEHLAARMKASSASIDEQVQSAVRLTLCREITADERTALTAYAKEHGLANLCRLLLNTNEFLFVN
jgi:cytochrome c5